MKRSSECDQSKNGSTDMGNVSKIISFLQPFIQIVNDDGQVVNYQKEFTNASITKRAAKGIRDSSVIMDLIEDDYFNKL